MSDQNSADSTNYSETVGTRLTPQTKRQFEGYREENELGKTEAARRLIRDGLDDTDETLDTIQTASILAGLAYLAVYYFGTVEGVAAVGGAFIAGIVVWSSVPDVRERV
jgi:hypothetical protein